MKITLFDVSREAGVSSATVSRVLNGQPLVKEQTRKRVEEAMRSLGYRPSHAARVLAGQRTHTLGVIFPEIDTGFFAVVLRGIDRQAAADGYHVLTAFSRGEKDELEQVDRFLRERRVDALILMNIALPPSYVKQLRNSDLPVVLLDRPVRGRHLHSISLDNIQGARDSVLHLARVHRVRRLGVITGPLDNYDSQQRLKGCRAAATASGIALRPDWMACGDFTEDGGYCVMQGWLKRKRPLPQAVMALNDAMAAGAWQALREHGRRVPDDILLTGFDDNQMAHFLDLTTVRVPMRELGEAGARAAIDGIKDRKSARRDILPTHLVIRTSCGCKTQRP